MTGFFLAAVALLPRVAIELPADAAPETVARVVESCNAALGAERCEAAADTSLAELHAVVSFDEVAIEIRLLRGEPEREVDSRRLVFSETDHEADRAAAAGLMVAALTLALPAPEVPAKPSESAPPAPEPVATPVSSAPPASSGDSASRSSLPLVGLDAAFQLGQALDAGGVKWGGALSLFGFLEASRLGALVGASHHVASAPVSLAWSNLAAGLALHLTPWTSRLGVELSAEGVLQRAVAEAEQGGQLDSASVVRGGARISAKALWAFGAFVEPWLGCELSVSSPGFDVRVGGASLGTEGPVRIGFSVGLRFVPFAPSGGRPVPKDQATTAAER